jgi:hypothetical protein
MCSLGFIRPAALMHCPPATGTSLFVTRNSSAGFSKSLGETGAALGDLLAAFDLVVRDGFTPAEEAN